MVLNWYSGSAQRRFTWQQREHLKAFSKMVGCEPTFRVRNQFRGIQPGRNMWAPVSVRGRTLSIFVTFKESQNLCKLHMCSGPGTRGLSTVWHFAFSANWFLMALCSRFAVEKTNADSRALCKVVAVPTKGSRNIKITFGRLKKILLPEPQLLRYLEIFCRSGKSFTKYRANKATVTI